MLASQTNSADLVPTIESPAEASNLGLGIESGTANNAARLSDVANSRFGGSSVFAQTARQAGRLNASSISKEEENELHAERKRLLDKKFAGTITKSEENKLQYVRWSLDRIDDAREGLALDRLERMIVQYENLSADIKTLRAQIEHATRRR